MINVVIAQPFPIREGLWLYLLAKVIMFHRSDKENNKFINKMSTNTEKML